MEAAHSEVGRGRIPKDKSQAVTTEGRTTNWSRLLKQEVGEGDCLEMNSRCVARVMGVNRDTAPPSLGIGQTGERLTRHSRERGKHRENSRQNGPHSRFIHIIGLLQVSQLSYGCKCCSAENLWI